MSRVGPESSWERPDRWRRTLGRGPSLRPASRPQTKIAAAALAGLVGFLAVIQARQQDDPAARLEAESPEDLARILADLNAEADALGRQVSSLRVKIERYRSTSQRGRLTIRDARQTVADLRVLAGVVPVEGPGISLTITDPERRVRWEGLLDLVQELRDAGAEALSINGRRIAVSTWFGPAETGVSVDGHELTAPYRLAAIGAADALRGALEIRGGPLAVMAADPGITAAIEEQDALSLPALPDEIRFQYARPTS
jgi:uncharacterized protein YlxW (UPF0749 family)